MTTKNIFIIILALFSIALYGQKSGVKQMRYIFFLHNKFLEDHSADEAHPKYGIVEYEKVLHQLKDSSNVILFEKRKPNTDPALYAMKIKKQIDRLIKKGVKAENITVVGTSQGGYIAQYVSFYQKNPGLRFVFVGASFKDDSLEKDPNFRLYGKILSITEKSDDGHVPLSQEQRFIRSNIKDFKEIELNTGLKHGFLFKALDAWIVPTKEWINSK
ncbi:alpha/beta hydrolase [Chryseobacterium indologenes]|uniref:alpha/beta hydrolase n=1 Tax=Chryseobacterium indologenes TaxID=253 RepID=UPI000F4DE959|nr:alpha/beta hydrolase [Chryseobacterium indologenes]AYZ35333.1 alpha/beta hydrolase [Chryseobacterium indologenes]MBF6644074.1 alpha/beta hydrolase [Chryseobacterium indologenes]MBU3048566.1 alpha/beta hydrolase [Chryseobacterium indologenes]MEB4761323.1 alpha/beta hydrolase [Chryseobacterium indologenes]QQQ72203.1 alpha/beta hydrolase [Chryseobacterium indologenes]